MVKRAASPKKFFSSEEKERILQAIREAEGRTSGEIRVYLERRAKGDLMDAAKKTFERLGMTKTKKRNGILIYFSLTDQTFALLGDRGIHDKVKDVFWKEVAAVMEEAFLKQDFAGGLEAGIRKIGEKLKIYFPREAGDRNELPDFTSP